jgi:subtilisin family serine protease
LYRVLHKRLPTPGMSRHHLIAERAPDTAQIACVGQVVVNLSLGTAGVSSLIDSAIQNAATVGNIVFVAAAGNSNVECVENSLVLVEHDKPGSKTQAAHSPPARAASRQFCSCRPSMTPLSEVSSRTVSPCFPAFCSGIQ